MGPVARASAVAWIAWADHVLGEFRKDPTRASFCADMLRGVGGWLEQWKRPDHSAGATFHWRAELDPDELEYLLHGFFSLERLAVDARECERAPSEARDFSVVLVRDLLRALEMEGAGRAAFVDQLRSYWPSAAAVS